MDRPVNILGAAAGPSQWKHRVTTPTVLQMQAVECGVAALAMILGYYKRIVPFDDLRRACGVSRDGTRASSMVAAARSYGLEAHGFETPVANIEQISLPFIAFWTNSHFVVVEGMVGTRIRINDPAIGRRSVSRDDFASSYSGIVLTFEPGPEFKPGGKQQGLLRTLLSWTIGSKRAFAVMLTTTALMAVPTLLIPALMKVFVDEILVRRFDTWMFPVIMSLIFAILLSAAITWLQQRTLMRLQMKLATVIATRFVWHILRLPLQFFSQRQAGDMVSRVQSAQHLAVLLSGPLPAAVAQSGIALLSAGVMMIYCLPLAIVSIILSIGNIIAAGIMRRRLKDGSMALLATNGRIASTAMAGLQSIESIKAMSTESDFFRIWSGYQARNVNQFQALGQTSLQLGAVPNFLGHLSTGVVLAYGAILIIDGQLSIGGLVAFQMLLGSFTTPLQQVISLSPQLQEAKGHLTRLEDVLSARTDPQLDQTAATPAQTTATLTGAVELKDIGFAYGPFDPPVLQNINLTIKPGQRIAIVGGSGSGKTTLVKLLLGLFQPTTGTVLYDGTDATTLPREQFTSSVAWVDQDIRLFSGSVFDNLTLFNKTIFISTVAMAARDARIHDTIIARPGGYESVVSEGGRNFSGGQRQRLEIARALARNPSILILDEATAALDAVTEEQIDANIRRRGLTCIIVAQRLSTIRDCDQIIVLKDGQIVERGVYRELIAASGAFAALVEAE